MRLLEGLPGPQEQARLLARLASPAPWAARELLGCILVRRDGGRPRAVRIIETEAYLGTDDPAAHAAAGRTCRTEPLWGKPGTLYVYLIYGIHHCLNLAVDHDARPGCVLIRAAEPLPGSGLGASECRGPGRLCRALGVDRRLSGHHLFEPGGALTLREGEAPKRVRVSPRVGISRAAAWPLRFFDADSAAVSASRPAGASSPEQRARRARRCATFRPEKGSR